MSKHPAENTPAENGKFGLRYSNMSEEELEYYREFWQEPERQEGEPDYQIPQHTAVNARVRMATGLSFTLLLLGVLGSLIAFSFDNLLASVACGAVVAGALGLLIAVRRRLFASLRIPGQHPVQKNKKAKLFWIPHTLVMLGVIAGIISFTIIPEIYADAEPNLRRSYVLLWNEISMLGLLMGAVFYGVFALAVYTPEDPDDSIIRPTDYAEKQHEKDIARGRRRDDDDFYDSSWISGK